MGGSIAASFNKLMLKGFTHYAPDLIPSRDDSQNVYFNGDKLTCSDLNIFV